jgi:hypothetical protein
MFNQSDSAALRFSARSIRLFTKAQDNRLDLTLARAAKFGLATSVGAAVESRR